MTNKGLIYKGLSLKPYTPKEIDEIKSEIKITYILYRIMGNGKLSSPYAQSQDFEKLANNSWIGNSDKGSEWIIKKRVTMLKEEPIFKVTNNKEKKEK